MEENTIDRQGCRRGVLQSKIYPRTVLKMYRLLLRHQRYQLFSHEA